jgi:hypothetical protein
MGWSLVPLQDMLKVLGVADYMDRLFLPRLLKPTLLMAKKLSLQ